MILVEGSARLRRKLHPRPLVNSEAQKLCRRAQELGLRSGRAGTREAVSVLRRCGSLRKGKVDWRVSWPQGAVFSRPPGTTPSQSRHVGVRRLP